MQLSPSRPQKIISVLFGLSPLLMLIFMSIFVYQDRNLYTSGAHILRVVTIAPFIAGIPYFIWKIYLKVKYLDIYDLNHH